MLSVYHVGHPIDGHGSRNGSANVNPCMLVLYDFVTFLPGPPNQRGTEEKGETTGGSVPSRDFPSVSQGTTP